MCGPCLRKVGQGIIEILIGEKTVTDELTYRRMDWTYQPINMHKAICPLFFQRRGRGE